MMFLQKQKRLPKKSWRRQNNLLLCGDSRMAVSTVHSSSLILIPAYFVEVFPV